MVTAYNRVWINSFLLLFILLSFLALTIQVGLVIRVSQIYLIALFGFILLNDMHHKTLDFKILSIFYIGALIMTLISFNSMHEKIGEIKFIIKYFIIFPAAFYVGRTIVQKITIGQFILIVEISATVFALLGFLFYFVPMPTFVVDLLINDRGFLEFKGTFFEPGDFATVVGLFLITSFFLRYEYKLWPKKSYLLIIFYAFLILALLFSRNKTIWVAYGLIALYFIFYKVKLSFHKNPQHIKSSLISLISKINEVKLLLLLAVIIVVFYFINDNLKEPVISWEILEYKWEHERGKALLAVLELLRESSWFGGYGFGFVESYFSSYGDEILGLGEGSGMIFNSYLDIWLSASIFGLIFHLTILYISFSSRYLFTMIVPLYLFIYANTNPAIGNEFYYLFLGLCYEINRTRLLDKEESL